MPVNLEHFNVVVIGELLVDFAIQRTDEINVPTLKANPGGAPGNFLSALSAYGSKTVFIGKVDEDAFGRLLIDTLYQARVNTQWILFNPNVFTSVAFITLDSNPF